MERINNGIKDLWDAVLAMNKQWMDAYSRGDAIDVGAFYTDDAQSLPRNRKKGSSLLYILLFGFRNFKVIFKVLLCSLGYFHHMILESNFN